MARFVGFNYAPLATGRTQRQSTGESASDFHFWPKVLIVPDVDGDFQISWGWSNTFDGAVVGDSAGQTISNPATGLTAGQSVEVALYDSRPGMNNRDGSIAIGDVDFDALGATGGQWHLFGSTVTITVTSPSGETVTVVGQLGPENFRCRGHLVAEFTGWNNAVIP